MKITSIAAISAMFTASLILASCENTEILGEDPANPELITIATGGTGGTYYPLGGTFSQLIESETGISATVVTSNASAENMAIINDGDAELAFVQTDIAQYAVDGTQMFEESGPVKTVLGLGTLYPETIQIVTSKSSGIDSVEDLAGKIVSVGEAGSGTRLNAEQILDVHGMSFEDIDARDLSFDDSTIGIQDGTIDAAFLTSGTPTGAVEGLGAQIDLSIIPIEDEAIDDLIAKYPYYARDEVAAGIYGLSESVPTVAVQAMLVISSEVSDDLAYDITKAIFENQDQIIHPKGQFISAENALKGMGISVHPGAQKYYKEKGIESE